MLGGTDCDERSECPMDEGGPFKLVEVPQRTGDGRWEATFEKD